ncbi:MAG: glutamate 5-kinase [Verrucomicrobia bacterium]|nr:glutamate 5-kinase [Verrucomicrobiota bacterium]
MRRQYFQNARRLVVKLGTGVLTNARREPDPDQMDRLVDQVAALWRQGREVTLVSSGAVAAGMGALGFLRRPRGLSELQACAAVGQVRLMGAYTERFARRGLLAAQVLLIHEDLADHERHLNARNTLVTLLKRRVTPIINENDTVSFTELKFGDNDRLSALVACLLPADALVILTLADGVQEGFGSPQARTIPVVERIDRDLERQVKRISTQVSVGGMVTKLQAARIAMRAGIPAVIACGRKPDALLRVVAGEEEGTLFVPRGARLRSRKRWIAFFHYPKGRLIVDQGAAKALLDQGKSLLAPGVRQCEGDFRSGDIVEVCDEEGREFARGMVGFSAAAIREGTVPRSREVIHRDNLVIL